LDAAQREQAGCDTSLIVEAAAWMAKQR